MGEFRDKSIQAFASNYDHKPFTRGLFWDIYQGGRLYYIMSALDLLPLHASPENLDSGSRYRTVSAGPAPSTWAISLEKLYSGLTYQTAGTWE